MFFESLLYCIILRISVGISEFMVFVLISFKCMCSDPLVWRLWKTLLHTKTRFDLIKIFYYNIKFFEILKSKPHCSYMWRVLRSIFWWLCKRCCLVLSMVICEQYFLLCFVVFTGVRDVFPARHPTLHLSRLCVGWWKHCMGKSIASIASQFFHLSKWLTSFYIIKLYALPDIISKTNA